MDVYARKGLKKLFSLTRTKLRLADESGTVDARPAPLFLANLFCGRQLRTVAECKTHWQRLKDDIDFDDGAESAKTTLQLCEIIESVKYGFESADDMPQISDEELARIEAACKAEGAPLRILLMTSEAPPRSLYFGEDPPAGARTYSRVVSGIAPFLRFAYRSPYLSDGLRLRNIEVSKGRMTLISGAAAHALETVSR